VVFAIVSILNTGDASAAGDTPKHAAMSAAAAVRSFLVIGI
jgi:hypothetical protein